MLGKRKNMTADTFFETFFSGNLKNRGNHRHHSKTAIYQFPNNHCEQGVSLPICHCEQGVSLVPPPQ